MHTKVAVERLGIVLHYRGPYIHVGDCLTNQLYSTNPNACDSVHNACDTPVTWSASPCNCPDLPRRSPAALQVPTDQFNTGLMLYHIGCVHHAYAHYFSTPSEPMGLIRCITGDTG